MLKKLIQSLLAVTVMVAVSWGAISQHSLNQRQTVREQARDQERVSTASKQGNDSCNAKCCQCELEKNWWGKTLTDPVASFTGVLALFTLGLIVVGVRQEIHFRDTARKELRAYVALENIYFAEKDRRQNVYGNTLVTLTDNLYVRVNNYGKTPSFNTTIRCNTTTTKPVAFDTANALVGGQMLHPGMGYPLGVNSPRSHLQFWAWGHFIYQDIYKRWWRTNFFYTHHPPADAALDLFTPETEHNNEKGPFNTEAEAIAHNEA